MQSLRPQRRKAATPHNKSMTMAEIDRAIKDSPLLRGQLSHQLADGGKNAGLSVTLRPIEKRTVGPRGV